VLTEEDWADDFEADGQLQVAVDIRWKAVAGGLAQTARASGAGKMLGLDVLQCGRREDRETQ
jgi:hypothetical protein